MRKGEIIIYSISDQNISSLLSVPIWIAELVDTNLDIFTAKPLDVPVSVPVTVIVSSGLVSDVIPPATAVLILSLRACIPWAIVWSAPISAPPVIATPTLTWVLLIELANVAGTTFTLTIPSSSCKATPLEEVVSTSFTLISLRAVLASATSFTRPDSSSPIVVSKVAIFAARELGDSVFVILETAVWRLAILVELVEILAVFCATVPFNAPTVVSTASKSDAIVVIPKSVSNLVFNAS